MSSSSSSSSSSIALEPRHRSPPNGPEAETETSPESSTETASSTIEEDEEMTSSNDDQDGADKESQDDSETSSDEQAGADEESEDDSETEDDEYDEDEEPIGMVRVAVNACASLDLGRGKKNIADVLADPLQLGAILNAMRTELQGALQYANDIVDSPIYEKIKTTHLKLLHGEVYLCVLTDLLRCTHYYDFQGDFDSREAIDAAFETRKHLLKHLLEDNAPLIERQVLKKARLEDEDEDEREEKEKDTAPSEEAVQMETESVDSDNSGSSDSST